MKCPTCETLMCELGTPIPGGWCGTCGTLRINGQNVKTIDVPELVDRCRKFKLEAAEHVTGKAIDIWKRIGIDDALGSP